MAIYQFKLGKLICTVMVDGAFTYARPTQILFPRAPQEQVAGALQAYNIVLDQWEHQLLGLGHVVLDGGGWQWQAIA